MTNKTWLAILTLIQGISTFTLMLGWRESSVFTIEHEDIIFIIFLSTYFIVAQLEKSIPNIIVSIDKNILKDN